MHKTLKVIVLAETAETNKDHGPVLSQGIFAALSSLRCDGANRALIWVIYGSVGHIASSASFAAAFRGGTWEWASASEGETTSSSQLEKWTSQTGASPERFARRSCAVICLACCILDSGCEVKHRNHGEKRSASMPHAQQSHPMVQCHCTK